jgi:preprotein translocase subunit SecD
MIVREDDNIREALPRLDRAIVRSIGAENLPAAVVEEEPTQALTQLLGQAGTDTLGAVADDSTAAEEIPQDAQDDVVEQAVPDSAQDSEAAPSQEPELRPLTVLLLESGRPGMFLVAEENVPTVARYIELPEVKEGLPRNTTLAWGTVPQSTSGAAYRELYVLEAEPLVTGEYLADAGPASRDPQFNQPYVPFEMTRQGARIFERGTSRNVGRLMAIVLDGRVQSAPVIRQTLSRRAQIELGAGSAFQEAQDLALVLRAGALPQPIRIVEERTIGPSLGADSVRRGRNAFLIGLAGVVLMMLWYYRIAGLMAVIALGMYVIFVLGALAGLGATLTLPGIAGLILSVGMAVDANVLIFERIREETDAGKTPRTAVEQGFQHATSAIVDANLTTLITAAILYQVGTGPIKGFAVTLGIGIIASFFTALFVTKTLFLFYLERRGPTEELSI